MEENGKEQGTAVVETGQTVEAQETALAKKEEKLLVPELYFEHLPKRMKVKFATHQAEMAMERAAWQMRQVKKRAAEMEAQDIAASEVFGPRVWQKVMAIGLCGKDLGLSLSQSMLGIHIVKDRPTLEARLMRALVQRSGKGHVELVVDEENERCTAIGHRKGQPDFTFTFGAKEAKAADYDTKPTYKAHPLQMYIARASSVVCRGLFPDIIGGMHSIEEMGYTPEQITEVEMQPEPTTMAEGRQSFGKQKVDEPKPKLEVEPVEQPGFTVGDDTGKMGKIEVELGEDGKVHNPPAEVEPEPVVEPEPEPEPEVDPDAEEIAAIRQEWINDDSDDPGDEGARRIMNDRRKAKSAPKKSTGLSDNM